MKLNDEHNDVQTGVLYDNSFLGNPRTIEDRTGFTNLIKANLTRKYNNKQHSKIINNT